MRSLDDEQLHFQSALNILKLLSQIEDVDLTSWISETPLGTFNDKGAGQSGERSAKLLEFKKLITNRLALFDSQGNYKGDDNTTKIEMIKNVIIKEKGSFEGYIIYLASSIVAHLPIKDMPKNKFYLNTERLPSNQQSSWSDQVSGFMSMLAVSVFKSEYDDQSASRLGRSSQSADSDPKSTMSSSMSSFFANSSAEQAHNERVAFLEHSL